MNFLASLRAFIGLYEVILLARCVVSWIAPGNYYQQPFKFLYDMTEPLLGPVRRVIPPIGMLDISVMVVFFGLEVIKSVL